MITKLTKEIPKIQLVDGTPGTSARYTLTIEFSEEEIASDTFASGAQMQGVCSLLSSTPPYNPEQLKLMVEIINLFGKSINESNTRSR